MLFWVLGTVAVVGAIGVVAAPKAVYSAMFLAMTMIMLAVFYIAQDALFLGVVQVVVYTGAVMMLFLFVLMLIGVDSAESLVETLRGQRVAAIVVGVGFGVLLIAGIGSVVGRADSPGWRRPTPAATCEGLAALIFTQYLWAFELTGALLITAALGAMVLAHRERFERAQDAAGAGPRALPAGRAPDARCPLPVSTPATTPSTWRRCFPTDRASELSVSALLQTANRAVRPTAAAEHESNARTGGAAMNPENYLYLSALLFTIGAAGVLLRRNAIVMFMCVELMLNAANLAFVDVRPDARPPRRPGGGVLHHGRRRLRGGGRPGDHHDDLPRPPFGLGRRRQPAEALKGRR